MGVGEGHPFWGLWLSSSASAEQTSPEKPGLSSQRTHGGTSGGGRRPLRSRGNAGAAEEPACPHAGVRASGRCPGTARAPPFVCVSYRAPRAAGATQRGIPPHATCLYSP